MIWGIKLSKDFALEVAGFFIYRSLSDGLSVLELNIDCDWYKGDHNPQFWIRLTLLNVTILEVRVYNVNHAEDGTVPIRKIQCTKCGEEIVVRGNL